MPPIGINPTVDFAFKLMLGSPDHTRVTIHFLNAILGESLKIQQVEIRNPLLGKTYDDDKLVILDILAKDDHGRYLNIEMQTSLPAGLRQRLTFYDARLYVEQLAEGSRYVDLRPAIVICVLSVPFCSDHVNLHSDFRMRDREGNALTDDLQIHILELTKLRVNRDNLEDASPIERWAYFLRNAESMTSSEVQQLLPDPEFSEAAGVLEMINKTPDQLHQYSARLKLLLDDAARMEHARQEGHDAGLREGRDAGLHEGRMAGELLGQVLVFQQLLAVDSPTHEELNQLDAVQLTSLLNELKQKWSSRG